MRPRFKIDTDIEFSPRKNEVMFVSYMYVVVTSELPLTADKLVPLVFGYLPNKYLLKNEAVMMI